MPHEVDIEQIVREVIAQLRSHSPAVVTATPKQAPALQATSAVAAPSITSTLEITDRLVTLATLENRLSAIGHVVLPRGAVVTPSARDLLRARGVQVSYATAIARTATRSLVIGVAELSMPGTRFDLDGFLASIATESLPIERVATTGLATVTAELADHATRGGRAVVLLTSRPEAAVCLANRRSGVRAVAARDTVIASRGIAEVAANFLAIDPSSAPAAWRRLLVEYASGWPRTVPALFQETAK